MARPDTLGFLLIGSGHIAPRHAAAIQSARGCALRCVFSRDPARAADLAARFGAEPVRDLDRALARTDVGAVAICTEHDRLCGMLRAAAREGRHVMVEKPLSHSVREAARSVREARKRGVVVACMYQRRADPRVREARAALRDGALGSPRIVHAELLWRRDRSYFERSPWRGQEERAGGGVLFMQAVHDLDLLRHLAGDVERVSAETARLLPGATVDDGVAAALRFRNGALGTLLATTAASAKRPHRVTILTTRGHLELTDGRLDRSDRPSGAVSRALRALGARRRSSARELFRAMYEDLADAVRNGREPLSSGEDALGTLRLAWAIDRAARTGARTYV